MMKKTITLIFFLMYYCSFYSQSNNECYIKLHQRGVEEYNKGNYELAKIKWVAAKDNCTGLSKEQKLKLKNLVLKVESDLKLKRKNKKKKTSDTVYKDRIIYRDKPVEKIVYRDKPVEKIVYRDKPVEKIVYRDKPVEKIVYRDKPVEKIVYRDKPEPFNRYGKGNGKLSIYKTCNCYNLKVWIDGKYEGKIKKYYINNGSPHCNSSEFSRILISGMHHVVAKDDENHKWEFYVRILDGECSLHELELTKGK